MPPGAVTWQFPVGRALFSSPMRPTLRPTLLTLPVKRPPPGVPRTPAGHSDPSPPSVPRLATSMVASRPSPEWPQAPMPITWCSAGPALNRRSMLPWRPHFKSASWAFLSRCSRLQPVGSTRSSLLRASPAPFPVASSESSFPNLQPSRWQPWEPLSSSFAVAEADRRLNEGGVKAVRSVVTASTGGFHFGHPPPGCLSARQAVEPPGVSNGHHHFMMQVGGVEHRRNGHIGPGAFRQRIARLQHERLGRNHPGEQ